MFAKSIRWRLQLWLAFLLACILTGFGVTAYQLHRTNRFNQIDEELERRVSALNSDTRPRPPFGPSMRPPFERGAGPPPDWHPGPDFRPRPRGLPGEAFARREIQLTDHTLSLFDETDPSRFYYAVWSREGSLLRSSSNAPTLVPAPLLVEAGAGIHTRMREANREAYQITEMGECVLAGMPLAADLKALRRFGWGLAAAGIAVLALGLGGGWVLATRAIRPVEAISAAASRMSAGNLAERISVADTDSELGRLAGVLNSTFARLEAAFAQQKQFTADASHELRTPITVIISEAQTALARERSAAEYRETIEACLDTAQRMRRLTGSLLELARFDAGQASLERAPFDLAEQARACVELIRPLAVERGLRIECDLAPANTLGDADRITQVITNLLINAVDYNRPHGEIRLTTRAENDVARLTVTDTGQGIAPEDLPRIFERFHRADKSRGHANGRSGLGLAICKAIMDAHGGGIEASSQPGIGSTFTVRLPA